MELALIGYGKMGRLIAELAPGRNHVISKVVDAGDAIDGIAGCDVAIDFSIPAAALDNIKNAIRLGVPIVSGTTGWAADLEEAKNFCKQQGGTFLYASNFSIGMNIFFNLNRVLARYMENTEGYRLSMEEIHHIQKTDAPSGTAISLAGDIIANSRYTGWELGEAGEGNIPITSKREGEVPGIHSVEYAGEIDKITIRHEAFNREGFALGALVAAEFIYGKKGVFTMEDVLDINPKNTKDI